MSDQMPADRTPADRLPNDHLDPLLREWHARNAARAHSLRETTLAAAGSRPVHADAPRPFRLSPWIGRGFAAAAVLALAVIAAFFLPLGDRTASAFAGGIVMLPDGGRLDALDAQGRLVGPCPLSHTDVRAAIAGPFTQVQLVQRYANPYRQPIEAVYTFPLSERGAVSAMRMTVRDADGERIVDGVVRERTAARQVYESARAQGFVASLLEQERPNVFTQSVANIAPGATVEVAITYVETLAARDGTYEFAFPMTVGPRYVPGTVNDPATGTPVASAPAGWARAGRVVLLGPGRVAITPTDDPARAAALQAELATAYAIDAQAEPKPAQDLSTPQATFTVTYADGSQEPGELFACGIGRIGGRHFFIPSGTPGTGQGFAGNTPAVPDASRITPMPVRPETRAGHDVSIAITLDTGGVEVREATSVLHGVDMQWDGRTRASIALRGGSTIPNKDFVLRWKLKDDAILEGVFSRVTGRTPAGMAGSADRAPTIDGYLTLVVNPPARVAPQQAVPRELVFVVDTSGSQSGFPIEKSKALMRRALASMRAGDTFNVVTFAGDTHVLWNALRPATKENVDEATKWIDESRAGGGTEMMKAIEAALVQMPRGATSPDADGRASVPPNTPVRPGGADAGAAAPAAAPAPQPMRLAIFLTDGYVGNDQGIVDAVRANAGSTRVFALGIGNGVNRWLIEAMAQAGRGASDVVLLADDADAAVARLTRRLETPVLADIHVTTEGIELADMVSGSTDVSRTGLVPDLWDAQPLVIHARAMRPGSGTVVIRGRTGEGPFERRIAVTVPASPEPGVAAHPMLPALWARAEVDVVLADHLAEVERQTLPRDIRRRVVQLGEEYFILTPFTSFVAVERTKVVSDGRPMLVTVPIELPEGTRFDSFFGVAEQAAWANDAVIAAARAAQGVAVAPTVHDEAGNATDDAVAASAGQSKAKVAVDPTMAVKAAEGVEVLETELTNLAAEYPDIVEFDPKGDRSKQNLRIEFTELKRQVAELKTELPRGGGPGMPKLRLERGDGGGAAGGLGGGLAQTGQASAAAIAPAPASTPPAGSAVPAAGEPAPSAAKPQEKEQAPTMTTAGVDATTASAVVPAVIPPADLDRLVRVLDPRLLALALFDRLPAKDKAALPPLDPDLLRLVVDGRVTVLLTALDAATLDALEKSGLALTRLAPEGIGARTVPPLAQASIPVARLIEVALRPGIRAIAPTENR